MADFAAMRLPFLQDIEHECLRRYPAVRLDRCDRVRFEATRKALNMSALYATSCGSGAREQVQNWCDQCRVAVADRQPDVDRLDSAVLAEIAQRHSVELADAKAYFAYGQEQLLGILLACTDKSGQQLLLLRNYGAQMTLDNLILGESTKRQDSMLAGQFGKGAKVEINRLVQEGCTVAYCTGNATWTFEQAVAPGCTIAELHVDVQPGSDIFDFVSIAIMAKSDYSAQLLEEDQCQCQRRPAVVVDPFSSLSNKTPQPLATFVKGDKVWYLQKDGIMAAGTVMSVDSSIQPPSYGVNIGGIAPDSIRNIDTEGDRLQRRHEQGSDHVSTSRGGAATGGTSGEKRKHDRSPSEFPQAAVGRPPAVKVIGTSVTPGVNDPLLFHNGTQAALASVLKRSAGLDCPEGILRSSNHPPSAGSADTVTVRLCPNTCRHPLRVTNILLCSCIEPKLEKRLHVPECFDIESWPNAKEDQKAAQDLYQLLERLHELIQPGLAPVNMYYDPDDGCIAINQGNKLWYNAHADHVYAGDPELQGIRYVNWYITVCHELAHSFRHGHDEVFSDYLINIALQHSRQFYSLCDNDDITVT